MAERILEQDALLVSAVETTYGTDAAPTAAAHSQRVDVDLTLHDGDNEELSFSAGRGGSRGSLRRNNRVTGTLISYLAGHGAVDGIPAMTALLQMAGLEPTVNAATSVTYAPISTDHDSVSHHLFRGKINHPFLGSRSNLEINLGTGALPKFTFNNLIGLYLPPTEEAGFQDADFSAFTNPLITDPTNITVMTLFGQPVNMAELLFKLGNQVVYRSVVNDESVQIVGRKPQIEITFEEPLISDFDWLGQQNEYGALAYQLGTDITDVGNIFELNVPNLQITNIDNVYIDGIAHLKLMLDVVPTARDNDFTFVYR